MSTAINIYSYKVKDIKGREISLEEYKGKVLLVVNTASECGFTPQYKGLEELYQKNKERGFVVLGFPCNQFGHQEPGNADQIESFCSLNFGVTFPLFEKVDVNGAHEAPVYEYLKKSIPGILGIEAIKWNFTKFLIGRDGKPVERFAPQTKPESLQDQVEKLL